MKPQLLSREWVVLRIQEEEIGATGMWPELPGSRTSLEAGQSMALHGGHDFRGHSSCRGNGRLLWRCWAEDIGGGDGSFCHVTRAPELLVREWVVLRIQEEEKGNTVMWPELPGQGESGSRTSREAGQSMALHGGHHFRRHSGCCGVEDCCDSAELRIYEEEIGAFVTWPELLVREWVVLRIQEEEKGNTVMWPELPGQAVSGSWTSPKAAHSMALRGGHHFNRKHSRHQRVSG